MAFAIARNLIFFLQAPLAKITMGLTAASKPLLCTTAGGLGGTNMEQSKLGHSKDQNGPLHSKGASTLREVLAGTGHS
jgi:hypothetical protein